MNPSTQRILDHVEHLPSLPTVLVEVINSFNNQKIDLNQLTKHIGEDIALTSKILRVANSPFYGLSKQIGSLQEAIMIIGFSSLRSIVIAASLIKQFDIALPKFDLMPFWHHSMNTACYARVISKTVGQNPDEAFIAGLLHDIGKLVIVVSLHDDFIKIQTLAQTENITIIEAEIRILGIDHSQIGSLVTEKWRFPSGIVQAIKNHHIQNDSASATLDGLIYVSNLLSHAFSDRNAEDMNAEELSLIINDFRDQYPQIEASLEEFSLINNSIKANLLN